MRVLHVSWEFPPLVYGGLGRHVHALASAQAASGDDVVVVTQTEDEPRTHVVAGVRVVAVRRRDPQIPFSEETLTAWVASLEDALTAAAAQVCRGWHPDVVHAHDWMVADTATTISAAVPAALVATIHATEAGRHQGWLPSELSRQLHSTEWRLANSSQRVITCSRAMRREAMELFDLAPERVVAVPNGIDLSLWRTTAAARDAARRTYRGDGPLLVHTGRLEWEKGLHTLLDAMATLRRRLPGVRLVVAGRGSKEAELKAQATRLRLGRSVEFVGWLPENELHALVAAADVSIVPSMYEPFGLVALEAAALDTPVVVAATGGLAEFAEDGRVALTFPPGDDLALADAIVEALSDTEESVVRAQSARETLESRYSWRRVAELTRDVYAAAVAAQGEHGRLTPTVPEMPPTGTRLLAAQA